MLNSLISAQLLERFMVSCYFQVAIFSKLGKRYFNCVVSFLGKLLFLSVIFIFFKIYSLQHLFPWLAQLKRLELRLKQFAEVETLLMKECEHVERARQRIAADRTRIMSTQFGIGGVTSSANMQGGNPTAVNNTGNNRQPVITGSSS